MVGRRITFACYVQDGYAAMSRIEYENRLREATPELGYGVSDPPATTAIGDVAEAKALLLMLGRGVSNEVYIREAVEKIVTEAWPVALLREQIQKLGVRPQGRTRVELAQQLMTLFYDRGRLELVFNSLDEETRVFYAEFLLNLQFSDQNPSRSKDILVLRAIKTPVNVLVQRIADAGLLFADDTGVVQMPPMLYRNLPHISVPAEPFTPLHPPARIALARPALTVTQIQQFLGLVEARKFNLRPVRTWKALEKGPRVYLKGFLPTPESARTLAKASTADKVVLELLPSEPLLLADDLETLGRLLNLSPALVEVMYQLLLALGVLRPGTPVQPEPALAEAFLALEPGEQLAAMARRLMTIGAWGPSWNFWREGDVRLQWMFSPYWAMNFDVQLFSQSFLHLSVLVLHYLALLPHEQWLAADSVTNLLQHFLPGGEPISRQLKFSDTRGSWEGFLGQYLEALLTGPLHLLGLCDVGRDRRGAFTAFRLHYLQNVVWEQAKAIPLPPTVWRGDQPDVWFWKQERLWLRPPVPAEVMQLLQAWAEPVGAEQDFLVYRPNVERLYVAFEAGETTTTLRERWVKATGAPPPPELAQWWENWQQRYGHIRLYPQQAILVAADALTLREVQVALPELREGLLGVINSRTALLRSEKVDQLLLQLTARGYMPKEVRSADAAPVASPPDTKAE